MRPKIYEFIVNGTVPGDTGRLNVIGRCGDIPIKVEDKFDIIFKYEPHKFPEESGRMPLRGPEKPVSLRVICIHAYQRSLPELGEGMTGSLTIDGHGADQVTPGWVLGRKDEEFSLSATLISTSDHPIVD